MTWRIEVAPAAAKELSRLDPPVARRIKAFLRDRVAALPDPRTVGQALKGSELGEFWKYRVGDWRIIARIEDDRFLILVLRVGNRREVYR